VEKHANCEVKCGQIHTFSSVEAAGSEFTLSWFGVLCVNNDVGISGCEVTELHRKAQEQPIRQRHVLRTFFCI